MKRLFVTTIIALTISTGAFAQRLLIKGGMNLPYMTEQGANMRMGFNIGPGFEINIGNMFSLETAVLFTTKGFKNKQPDYTTKINMLNLEIPINAKLYFNVGAIKLFGEVGPYLGIGVGGKIKREFTNGKSTAQNIVWGSEDGHYKRLDVGLNVGAGIEFFPVQISLQYGIGLVDLGPSDFNRVLALNFAFLF